MKVIDLTSDTTMEFDHDNVLVAFAYAVYDKQTNIIYNIKDISKRIKKDIKSGKYGYHYIGYSIPFSSLSGEACFDIPEY